MSFFRAYVRFAAAILPLLIAAPTMAQDNSNVAEASEAVTENESAPARPARPPELHYLLDGQGKLVPVPGFRWEDFARLLSIQRQDATAAQPPRFVIERVHVAGDIQGARAELQVRMDVDVNAAGWTPIPLRFDHCALLEYSAEGAELRLEPNAASKGFLGWFRTEQAGPVQCKLRLIKSLGHVGVATSLALDLPHSVRNDLAIRVPEAEVTVELAEDEGMASAASDGDGGSVISVQAMSSSVHLSWSSSTRPSDDSTQTLEATGALSVRLDGDGVATTATLSLRSTGRPIESFQVRLPSGAILLPERYPNYSVEVIDGPPESGARVVEVHLFEPNTVAEVAFQTRQDWSPPDRPLDLGGFDVVGAIRQRGHVAIAVSEDVRAEWEERFLVRQVDDIPQALQGEANLAGFEYSGQPFSLLASVFPRVTRLTIEPQYVVTATPQELVLNARLKCRVRDGRLHQLKIDLGEWSLDENGWGPAGLVAEDDVVAARTQPLSVPFQRPLTGEFELRFEARRPIESGAAEIAFRLPRPEATVVGQAQLVVLPADNVRLTPRSEAAMKLVAQRPDPAINLSKTTQPPQFYRGEIAAAEYASGFEVKAREVRASVSTQATWRESSIAMRQVIKYQVANQGLDRVSLAVPRGLTPDSNLRLTLLDAAPALLAISAAGRGASEPVDVFLPSPRLGEFQIEVRYELPWRIQDREAALPLIQPRDAATATNALEIIATEGLAPALDGAEWRPATVPGLAGAARWVSAEARTIAMVQLTRGGDAAIQQDLVERAWVQSQLVNDLRQDRVVWRVSAPDGAVTVRLPEGVLAKDVLAMVDGTAVSPVQEAHGDITISWQVGASVDSVHVLELDYRIEGVAGSPAGNLPAAQLASPGRMKQLQWELLLPTQQHLLSVAESYRAENRWQWRQGYWARIPSRESAELELWAGGAARGDLPTQSNRYLVSSFGAPRALQLRTGTRSSLVLIASVAVSAVGLSLMFLPAALRPPTLLFTVVASIVGLAFAGDLAVLLLQSAAPGVVPVAAALALHAWNNRRNRPTLRLQGSTHTRRGSSIVERFTGGMATSSHSSRRTIAHTVPDDAP